LAVPPGLETERLRLEPLTAAHADEMTPLLDDPALHAYVGGTPLSREELRERYARQARGRSPDGRERWLNWIVRERASGAAVGYVQATVDDDAHSAEIAWVIGSEFQGNRYAVEAAAAMVAWLAEDGIRVIAAHIRPGHTASAGVARAVGLTATSVIVDGEVRWERPRG
jgi:RimJ/RimL family protein N-acetyltransferase